MKIAIFLTQQFPENGGSYTYENLVLEGIFKYASNSHHNFILYSACPKLPQVLASIMPDNIRVVHTRLTLAKNLYSKVYRHTEAFVKKIVNPQQKYLIESGYQKRVRELLLVDKVDLTWSFTPSCPTVEIPYITTVWDLQHRLQPYFPEVSLKGEWQHREKNYREILPRAAYIITGTARGKHEIQSFYQIDSERIKIVPFPSPKFNLASDVNDQLSVIKKYNIPANYLFYPAQFWSHKNHISLLLALKYLKEEHDLTLPVIFVGSDQGNFKNIKQAINQLNLSAQVYCLGFVPREDLFNLYKNALCLVYLSLFGPDNLPPLEAFTLNCPVIAGDIPGAKEQLGESAILVSPVDEKEIALAIKILNDNSDLRENLKRKGQKRALSWTLEDYIKSMLNILDEFEKIQRCWKVA